MTRESALAFLKLSLVANEDEVEDVLEQELFVLKQFFISKVPIQKLFQSRIEKLKQLEKVWIFFLEAVPQKYIENTSDLSSSDELMDVFLSYHEKNKQLKADIVRAQNPIDLLYLVEKLLILESNYAQLFFEETNIDEDLIVSKEPDPMELLQVIKELQLKGIRSFDEIKKNKNQLPIILVNEMKRLSLLFYKYRWKKHS